MTDTAEDFLEVDAPIPGQTYGVFSFLSPEKVLKKKEVYFMSEYLKWLCDQSDFLNNAVLKGDKTKLDYEAVKGSYDDFIYSNEERLEDKFHEMEEFRTTVRGFKCRGVYATQREADVRAKVLQRLNKYDNIFIGPLGYWLPWDPNPDRIAEQEYAESELNNLMKKYKENSTKRDIFYQQQKEEQIRATMEERLKKEKEKSAAGSATETQDVESQEKMFGEEDPWLKQKRE